MNLGELKTTINNIAEFQFNDDFATSIINLKLQEIYTERDWQFLFTESTFQTVQGQTDYSIGTVAEPVMNIDLLWQEVTTPFSLVEMNHKDFAQYVSRNNQFQRTPEAFVQMAEKGKIRIFPSPDAIITIRADYFKKLLDLSLDTDENYITINYPYVVIYSALAELQESDSKTNRSINALQLFKNAFKKMIRIEDQNTPTRRYSIKDTSLERRRLRRFEYSVLGT